MLNDKPHTWGQECSYLTDQTVFSYLQSGPHFLNICSGKKTTVVTNLFFIPWKISAMWNATQAQCKDKED